MARGERLSLTSSIGESIDSQTRMFRARRWTTTSGVSSVCIFFINHEVRGLTRYKNVEFIFAKPGAPKASSSPKEGENARERERKRERQGGKKNRVRVRECPSAE